jgi:hypothetical protein
MDGLDLENVRYPTMVTVQIDTQLSDNELTMFRGLMSSRSYN